MIVTIHPSRVKGILRAPASKSSMQRACAAALLSKGTTTIYNPGHSNDDKAALKLIEGLGATFTELNGEIIVESKGINPLADTLNCGESGLGIRMFTPIISLSNREITINGHGSLLNRPMDFFDRVLPQLGVDIQSNNGRLPLKIKGPLQPKDIEIDGSVSSQFLTGLLMAYVAAGAENVSIKVKDLKSKPYIDLTLNVMKQFGWKLPENKEYKEFYFPPNPNSGLPTPDSRLRTHNYHVEGDWSGASFILVAGAISGSITITGLDMMSAQADKEIVNALMSANAGIAIEAKGVKVHSSQLKAFEFDATDCPDLFPPLVALAAFCSGTTILKGVKRLVHKESNRAITLQEEFGKMGVKIKIDGDRMNIQGGGEVAGAKVQSHHDHRIAMACAVAALQARNETTIEEAAAVNKSYPDFYWHLKKLGADVSLNNRIKFHE